MFTLTAGLFPPDTATITRSLPELFDVPPENIVIDTVAGSARLRCVSPVAVDLLWLMDTILLQAATRNFLIRSGVSTPGFYQCASARTGDSINLYASEEESIYILRACKSLSVEFPVHINYVVHLPQSSATQRCHHQYQSTDHSLVQPTLT